MSDVELRPATSEDLDFLYHVHRAAMRDYVAQTWGWDEQWQREHFRQHFDPSEAEIIRFGGQDVGYITVDHREDELFLANIAILPEYQNLGIGTFLIRKVLAEAKQLGRPATLQVLKVNPARSLYEQLGFVAVGETATHYVMRATPVSIER